VLKTHTQKKHIHILSCVFFPKLLYFQPEISLLLAPPCHMHDGLGRELQATVDAQVVPGRPLLAGPLHVDPLLLLGGHLQAPVDAVPEGLLNRQEVLKTGREAREEREERKKMEKKEVGRRRKKREKRNERTDREREEKDKSENGNEMENGKKNEREKRQENEEGRQRVEDDGNTQC
jgi:hypothetical protein